MWNVMGEGERRRNQRVHLKGSVVVRFAGGVVRGRLIDLASRSMRIECQHPLPRAALLTAPLEIELRLDGPVGGWVHLAGSAIALRGGSELAIRVVESSRHLDHSLSDDFSRQRRELGTPHVMIVDGNAVRRAATAEAFREEHCVVIDVTTAGESIWRLEGASTVIIAIADTVPLQGGQDLRRFLGARDATTVIATGDNSTSDEPWPWLCTSDTDHLLGSRIRRTLRATMR
jgi:hypothetical protein